MYEEDFWILFENINGLLVSGTGTVDGQGNAVWKYNDGGSRFPSVSNKIILTYMHLLISN
jgi:galacturan 1,4-alpha-galacturonidase